MTGPYADSAFKYWDAGWHGVLPLPRQDKYPPPRGFTGAEALMPSYADVYAWAESEGEGNVGLRFPPGLVGIDVDAYDGKVGGVTFAEKLARWGPLPDTWRLSSRDDGLSGIYVYRVPEGLRWPGTAGPGIDIIEHRYRYAVAWPSVHPNGNVYQWLDGLNLVGPIPAPHDFPALPASWIDGLTHGQAVTDIAKVELDDTALGLWLMSRPEGQPCSEMNHSVIRTCERLISAEHSRHETMVKGVMHLCHLSAEGHHGLSQSLSAVRDRFLQVASVGSDPRSESAASAEWHRALSGAAGVALADVGGELDALDPCRAPLGAATLPAGGMDHAPWPAGMGAPVTDAQGAAEPHGDGVAPGGPAAAPLPLDANHVEGNGSVKPVPPDMSYYLMRLNEEIDKQDIREMARDIRETRKAEQRWVVPSGSDIASAVDPPEIQWVIEDVMPVDTNIVLTAQYKSGKTTMVLNLARSLADDEKFLGLYPVVPFPGSIALWNYEVSESMFTRWAKSQNMTNGERVHMLHLRGHTTPLGSAHIRKWTVEYLRSRNVSVWVLDPFARAMQGDENSNEDVGRFLDLFDEIKAEAGVKIGIIVNHTGRAEGAADRSRGATRIDDWADVRWLLSSDDDRFRYFAATGRDVETVPARLSFDPLSRRLTLSGEAKPSRTRTVKRNLADDILSAVDLEPGMGMRAIIDAVGGRHGAVTEQLRLLEQQRRVTVVRRGEGKSISVYTKASWEALNASQ